jgi:hypothetical protein
LFRSFEHKLWTNSSASKLFSQLNGIGSEYSKKLAQSGIADMMGLRAVSVGFIDGLCGKGNMSLGKKVHGQLTAFPILSVGVTQCAPDTVEINIFTVAPAEQDSLNKSEEGEGYPDEAWYKLIAYARPEGLCSTPTVIPSSNNPMAPALNKNLEMELAHLLTHSVHCYLFIFAFTHEGHFISQHLVFDQVHHENSLGCIESVQYPNSLRLDAYQTDRVRCSSSLPLIFGAPSHPPPPP